MENYFIKSIASGLGNSVVSGIVLFLALPLVITNIGLEAYGQVTLLYVFVGLANVASIGFPRLYIYAQKSKRREPQFVLNSYRNYLILKIKVVLTLLCISSLIIFTPFSVSNTLSIELITLGTILFVVESFSIMCRAILEANLRLYIVNLGYLMQTIVLNFCFVLASFKLEMSWIIYIVFLSLVFTSLFFILPSIPFFYKFADDTVIIKTKKTNIWAMLKPFAIGSILTAGFQPMGRLFSIGMTGSYATAAYFDIIIRLSAGAQSLLYAVSNPVYAYFSSGNTSSQGALTVLIKFTIIATILYIVGMLCFVVLQDKIFPLFHFDNVDLYPILFASFGAICLTGIIEPLSKYMVASGLQSVINKSKAIQYASYVFFIGLWYLSGFENGIVILIYGFSFFINVLFLMAWAARNRVFTYLED